MDSTLLLATFQFNDFAENTYLIYTPEGAAYIVDPGCHTAREWDRLRSFIDEEQCKPKAIIATHAHLDHIFAVEKCRREWDIPFMLHPLDQEVLENAPRLAQMWGLPMDPIAPPDLPLTHGQLIPIGNHNLEVIHTPGHSPGGICLFISGDQPLLFAGDTLFAGSIGRSDLPGGNYVQLIQSIKQRLLTLPDDTTVLPGHGPQSTIAKERRSNPFLL